MVFGAHCSACLPSCLPLSFLQGAREAWKTPYSFKGEASLGSDLLAPFWVFQQAPGDFPTGTLYPEEPLLGSNGNPASLRLQVGLCARLPSGEAPGHLSPSRPMCGHPGCSVSSSSMSLWKWFWKLLLRNSLFLESRFCGMGAFLASWVLSCVYLERH